MASHRWHKLEGLHRLSSYTCEDNTYIYTMNISPDGNTITDISVVSLDGNSTYLFTFVYEEDSYE